MDKRLAGKTIYELVSEEIRQGVKEGRYKSGNKIKEADLCEKFKVSRTPIREAFRQLQNEGVLVYVPQKGVQIPKLGSVQLLNVQQIRTELEKISAYNAAMHPRKEDIQKLKEINNQILSLQEECPEAAGGLDHTFHLAIADMGDNPLIRELLNNLFLRNSLFEYYLPFKKERIPHTYQEHQDIIEAIILEDPELAKKYMDIHFHYSTRSIMTKLTSFEANTKL